MCVGSFQPLGRPLPQAWGGHTPASGALSAGRCSRSCWLRREGTGAAREGADGHWAQGGRAWARGAVGRPLVESGGEELRFRERIWKLASKSPVVIHSCKVPSGGKNLRGFKCTPRRITDTLSAVSQITPQSPREAKKIRYTTSPTGRKRRWEHF